MIGIIGFGFVGQAVYSGITDKNRVKVHDKYKDIDNNRSLSDIMECSKIFVCVSTPMNKNGSCNTDNTRDVLYSLKDYQGIIIIKSTMPFDEIPTWPNICYNPEFLNERTAIQDFKNQKYIVLGGNIDVTQAVQSMYESDFSLSVDTYEHCTIQQAVDFKYIRNTYQAYKVLFWEYVQDVTGDARKIAMMLENIPMNENTQVSMDGYRGFGGSCLPKDVSAIDKNHPHILTKFMLDFNRNLRD